MSDDVERDVPLPDSDPEDNELPPLDDPSELEALPVDPLFGIALAAALAGVATVATMGVVVGILNVITGRMMPFAGMNEKEFSL